MKIGYIRETEESHNTLEKISLFLKKIFNIIDVKEDNGKIIYYLPISNKTKLTKYRIKRILKKLVIILEKEGIYNIAVSKYLNQDEFKLYLYSQNINILNGRYLFKCLGYDLLKYIFDKKKKQMELRRSQLVSQ